MNKALWAVLLVALAGPAWAAEFSVDPNLHLTNFQKVIVAGSATGSPPDSPANRVDPNTTTSPFAGVGSLFLDAPGPGGFLCTGTPVSSTRILTAAHCLDTDDNGSIDFAPGDVRFFLNYGGNLTHSRTASALAVHPDWTGFNNPSINDDVAVITLSSALPAGVPIYPLYTDPFVGVITLAMVGYGLSGFGDVGYTTGASFTVKRVGQNRANLGLLDDEGSGATEVFVFDFDGPSGNGPLGGPTLGNDIETTLGGGDSGGPSFIFQDGIYKVAGVNTFTVQFAGGPAPPLFGSGGGGTIVPTYADWISSQIVPEPSTLLLLGSGLVWLGVLGRKKFKRKSGESGKE